MGAPDSVQSTPASHLRPLAPALTMTHLLICENPLSSDWQLGLLPPRQGTLELLGWACREPGLEGGVPQPVQQLLARVWVGMARLDHLSQDDTQRRGWARVFPSALRGPASTQWFNCVDPSQTQALFHDSGCSWSRQGQALLLSEAHAPKPRLESVALDVLLSDDWWQLAPPLRAAGVEAVVRPGVDGAVAGLWWLEAERGREPTGLQQRWRQALAREVGCGSASLSVVSEEEFRDRVAHALSAHALGGAST